MLPRPGQIVQAVQLISEPQLKLDDAPRKVWSGHAAKLEALPDKTGYAWVQLRYLACSLSP